MNYTCPYCNQATTITSPNHDEGSVRIDIAKDHLKTAHRFGIKYESIACPNQQCKGLTLTMQLRKYIFYEYNWVEGGVIQEWQLLPESTAKPQPEYIPEQLVVDYNESCRILNLSPKASATLARRCLQGMIRDFWGIKKGSLKLEIDELENHVSSETWEAIDAIRSVGNIGAHMEKDVNMIVDIEPAEASLLINLIEDLFDEWYVVKHERQERQSKLIALAKAKKQAKTIKNNTR